MRVAALYDIHGNLPALEAVLAEIERSGVEVILLGGDIATGPMPRETLDLLMSLDGLGIGYAAFEGTLIVSWSHATSGKHRPSALMTQCGRRLPGRPSS